MQGTGQAEFDASPAADADVPFHRFPGRESGARNYQCESNPWPMLFGEGRVVPSEGIHLRQVCGMAVKEECTGILLQAGYHVVPVLEKDHRPVAKCNDLHNDPFDSLVQHGVDHTIEVVVKNRQDGVQDGALDRNNNDKPHIRMMSRNLPPEGILANIRGSNAYIPGSATTTSIILSPLHRAVTDLNRFSPSMSPHTLCGLNQFPYPPCFNYGLREQQQEVDSINKQLFKMENGHCW